MCAFSGGGSQVGKFSGGRVKVVIAARIARMARLDLSAGGCE